MPYQLDFELDEHGYMLGEGGSSVATVNNPPGLRTAGGNVLREYVQWAEEEWAGWPNGAGQRSPGDSGYLHSSGDTLQGDWRLAPQVYKGTGFEAALSARQAGGCYFVEYNGHLIVGSGNRLRYFRRNTSTYAPEKITPVASVPDTAHPDGDIYFVIDTETIGINWGGRAWYNTAHAATFPFTGTAEPQFINNAVIKPTCVIRGMCVFGDYLAMVIVDTSDVTARPDEASPATADLPNTVYATGLYLVDLKPLLTVAPTSPRSHLPVACTGYFAFATGARADEPDQRITRYSNSFKYEAIGCAAYDGLLWFWSGDYLFYSPGDLHQATRDALITAGKPIEAHPLSVANWAWYGIPLAQAAHHSLSLWRDADGQWAAPYEVITGMVSLQGMTVQEKTTYVATTHALYSLLPGDEFNFMAKWDSVNWWNGMNPIEHAGDAYFPVGYGLWRVTPTGQMVRMGLNTMPVQPHRALDRQGVALCSMGGRLLAMSEVPYPTDQAGVVGDLTTPGDFGNIVTRVWAYEGQGWHPVCSRHPNDDTTDTDETTTVKIDKEWMWQAQGMYYQPGTHTLWFVTGNGHVSNTTNVNKFRGVHLWCATVTEVASQLDALPSTTFEYRYRGRGWLVLPPFDAGAVTLLKDYESIAVYGRCFTAGSTIGCYYRRTTGLASAIGCERVGVHYADAGWTLMETKTFTGTQAGLVVWEFPMPRGVTQGSSAIEIKFLVRRGTDQRLSPVIEAIRLQHHDYIRDYYRFNLNISLPGKCLTDACGVMVAGYSRPVYDKQIRDSVCKTIPIKFIDVDGITYYVRVDSASRRASNLGIIPTTGQRNLDITWSLVLTQVWPDSICDIVGVSPWEEPAEAVHANGNGLSP